MRPDLNCRWTDRQTDGLDRHSSDGRTGKGKETETGTKYQVGQTASQSNGQRDRQVCERNRLVGKDSEIKTGRQTDKLPES